MQLVC